MIVILHPVPRLAASQPTLVAVARVTRGLMMHIGLPAQHNFLICTAVVSGFLICTAVVSGHLRPDPASVGGS
jgi:hypothetical protein